MTIAAQEIPTELIDDTDRLRPVDPAWAEALAATMSERGLDQPIVVRPVKDRAWHYALVAGGHRLAAAKLLGWATIRAEIRDLDALQARMAEIDENLFRNELNPFDRGYFLRERKRLYEQLYPETVRGRAPKPKKGGEEKSQSLRPFPPRFTAEAAEKIGLSERTVQDAIALVEAIDPQVMPLLRQTDLVNNAAALKTLGSHPPQDQFRLVRAIVSGEARDLKQARVHLGFDSPTAADPQEVIFNKLVELYGRANQKTKRRFEEHAGLVFGNQVRAA